MSNYASIPTRNKSDCQRVRRVHNVDDSMFLSVPTGLVNYIIILGYLSRDGLIGYDMFGTEKFLNGLNRTGGLGGMW